MKSNRRKSVVWNYFSNTESDTRVQCNMCGKTLSRGKKSVSECGTSCMRKHLYSKHQDVYQKVLQIEGKKVVEHDLPKITMFTGLQPCQEGIVESSPKKDKWAADNPQAKAITNALIRMILVDKQPLSMVEDNGFTHFCSIAVPNYVIPSRQHIAEKILPKLKVSVTEKIKSQMTDAQDIVLSLDIWTSEATELYFGITAHWLTTSFEPKMFVLNVAPAHSKLTAVKILQTFNAVLDQWCLPRQKIMLVVHDGSSNMVKAMKSANLPSITCFAHSLNLVIQEGLLAQEAVSDMILHSKKLVDHFRYSHLAKSRLKEIQQDLQLPQHSLIQKEPSRWNMLFAMVERLGEQKRAIIEYDKESDLPVSLSSNEWKLIEMCIAVLSSFDEAGRLVNGGTASISLIIPLLKLIESQMLESVADASACMMKAVLLEELQKRCYDYGENKSYTMATILDPRFKDKFFLTDRHKITATEDLIQEYAQLTVDETDSVVKIKVESSPKRIKLSPAGGSLWSSYDVIACQSDNSQRGMDAPRAAVESYLREPLIARDNNPLVFWNNYKKKYPVLSKMAKKYLTPPPGCVCAERIFDVSSEITEDRHQLLMDNIEILTFLKVNFPRIELPE